MGIRYLAGGSWADIRLVCGVSKTSFYRSVYKFLDGLLSVPDLRIRFPSSEDEKKDTTAEFEKRSKHKIHRSVLSCVDEWLYKIEAPLKSATDNFSKFFSGHSHTFGLNIQARSNGNLLFKYVSVICHGGTNDAMAFEECGLKSIMVQMSGFSYILESNSYIVSERILTPFCESDGMTVEGDNYNFFCLNLEFELRCHLDFRLENRDFLKDHYSFL